MSQRRLLFDDEGPAADEVAALLSQMECVMQFTNGDGRWHARALGAPDYGHGSDPVEAMQEAVAVQRRTQRPRSQRKVTE